MEEEIYEVDYENCSYCETTYYENDTGYREYGCSLWTGNADDNVCVGGYLEDVCPLAFRYWVDE